MTTAPEVESVPPKKIKPEVEGGAVSKAEVKQIQRNLKTMPLEDGSSQDTTENQPKDMDDVESETGSNGNSHVPQAGTEDRTMEDSTVKNEQDPEDLESSTSELGDIPNEARQAEENSISRPSSTRQTSTGSSESSTPASTSTSTSTPTPKLGGGFSNTSTVSPFAQVATGVNVFGSSSTSQNALGSTSSASPFAAVSKSTNVFDTESAAPSSTLGLSRGFSNTSSASPFATASAGSTNIFGSSGSSQSVFGQPSKSVFDDSTKSVFGEPSTTTSVFGASSQKTSFSDFGSASKNTPAEETTGSVFGSKSVLGSFGRAPSSAGAFGSSDSENKTPSLVSSSSFGTFGAKQSFLSKEGSFASGSFLDQSASQDKGDFDSLLTQETGENDGENDGENEDNEASFGTGIFTNADQVD
ncbi:hypothetical protein BGZ94_005780, partial [Podila epigama]